MSTETDDSVPPRGLLGAVTHGTAADAAFLDIVFADEEWLRREFDELVEAGWGGSRPTCPRIRQGAHGPRRSGPRSRPVPVQRPAETTPFVAWRAPARGPPA
jgi:hypothetical protein